MSSTLPRQSPTPAHPTTLFPLTLLYLPLRLNVVSTCLQAPLPLPMGAGSLSISLAAVCGPVPRAVLALVQYL